MFADFPYLCNVVDTSPLFLLYSGYHEKWRRIITEFYPTI